MKRNKPPRHATASVNLKSSMPSERSQMQKARYFMIPSIRHTRIIGKNYRARKAIRGCQELEVEGADWPTELWDGVTLGMMWLLDRWAWLSMFIKRVDFIIHILPSHQVKKAGKVVFCREENTCKDASLYTWGKQKRFSNAGGKSSI